MSAVVLFGPYAVRGPHPVRAELASAAVTSIDDRWAVVDDRPVAVDTLVHSVLAAAIGDAEDVVVVVPGWWPAMRVARVRALYPGADVRRRPQVLREASGCEADVVIEIADDLVVASADDTVLVAVPRLGELAAVAEAVAGPIPAPVSVVIDIPAEVRGGRELAAAIAARLRRRGADVDMTGDHRVRRAIREPAETRHPRGRPGRRAIVGMAAVGVAAVASAWVLRPDTASDPVQLVTEGRVVAEVPARWIVERVVAGSGSRRLEITEPGGEHAIVIVQSPATPDPAAVLETALQHESPEVFTDFDATDHRAGRAVVSYTERRDGRSVEWAVFVDGAVRIAVGCQSATPDEQLRDLCDRAIGSAQAVP